MTHHRDDEHDFTVEPVPGLPEALPKGETILWQGRPKTLALARSSVSLGWIMGYFAALALWQTGARAADIGWGAALPYAVPFLLGGLVVCAILLTISWLQSRATLYTVTTERVVMRIGTAITINLNLPFQRIASADLAPAPGGTGTIALETVGDTQLSYAVLWPHVRPWHMRRVKPALRCIPDAERVARLLAEAFEARMSRPEVAPQSAIAAE